MATDKLSTISWFGSKKKMIWILQRKIQELNPKFDTLVEVFGGSGELSLHISKIWKNEIKIIYNDINKDLVDYMYAVSKNKLNLALINEATFSEKKALELQRIGTTNESFLTKNKCEIYNNGIFSKKSWNNNFNPRILNRISTQRLLSQNWSFTNLDYKEVLLACKNINNQDKKNTIVYLDPPYNLKKYKNVNKKLYKQEKFDYQEFVREVNKLDLNIIISINNYGDKILDDFPSREWEIETFDIYYQSSHKWETEVIITKKIKEKING